MDDEGFNTRTYIHIFTHILILQFNVLKNSKDQLLILGSTSLRVAFTEPSLTRI